MNTDERTRQYGTVDLSRDTVIQEIKAALKRRSGRAWSVTGGRGTAWGWIKIESLPKRQTMKCRLKEGAIMTRPEDYEMYDSGPPGGSMTPEDCAALARLLGLETVDNSGESIAASNDYRQEYLDRAQGWTPRKIAQPYWD